MLYLFIENLCQTKKKLGLIEARKRVESNNGKKTSGTQFLV